MIYSFKNCISKIKINVFLYGVIGILFLSSSCKTTKRLFSKKENHNQTTQTLNNTHSKKHLFRTVNNLQEKDFESLACKIGLQYQESQKQTNAVMSLRLEKGKKIWISVKFLGFTVAKLLATPKEVIVYEKIKKQYFKGDYSYFKKEFHVDLDYQALENLLIGNTIVALDDKDIIWNTNSEKQRHILQNKEQEIYQWFGVLLSENLQLEQQRILDSSNLNNNCTIQYLSYQEGTSKKTEIQYTLPKELAITLQQNEKENKKIHLDYKNIVVDQKLQFPFEIPQGYRAIK